MRGLTAPHQPVVAYLSIGWQALRGAKYNSSVGFAVWIFFLIDGGHGYDCEIGIRSNPSVMQQQKFVTHLDGIDGALQQHAAAIAAKQGWARHWIGSHQIGWLDHGTCAKFEDLRLLARPGFVLHLKTLRQRNCFGASK